MPINCYIMIATMWAPLSDDTAIEKFDAEAVGLDEDGDEGV